MHINFADWYRDASVAPNLEELNARFAAVQAAAQHLSKNRSDAPDLVEVVFGLGGKEAGSIAWFINALKTVDPTLQIGGNDRVLVILAGCTLSLLLTSGSADWSDLATLVKATSLAGTRIPTRCPYIIQVAAEAIARRQLENRRPVALSDPTPAVFTNKVLETALAKLGEDAKPADFAHAFSALGKTLTSAHREAFGSFRRNVEELQRQSTMLREETDMLWWILGGWIPAMNAPLADIAPEATSLVIGCQLAGFTRLHPAPLALDAIMARAFAQRTSADLSMVVLHEAIAGMPDALLSAYALKGERSRRLGSLLPVSLAITRAAEDREIWTRGYEERCAVKADVELSARGFAMQVYHEQLAAKHLGQ